MGWGIGDEPRVMLAKVQLSQLRQAMYRAKVNLTDTLAEIDHKEKGARLRNLMVQLEKTVDAIGFELDR